jgi:hypothetical protein
VSEKREELEELLGFLQDLKKKHVLDSAFRSIKKNVCVFYLFVCNPGYYLSSTNKTLSLRVADLVGLVQIGGDAG